MRGLQQTAKESRAGQILYFDWDTQTANTTGKGWRVCTFTRPNTEKEIEEAIKTYLKG